MKLVLVWGLKAHYNEPFSGTFGSNIIVNIIQLFQKCGAFNFGYQLNFLGHAIIIFTKLMLCNLFLKITINFNINIVYIYTLV